MDNFLKRNNYRILVGAVLILGGLLMLLDRTGILRGATDFFWAGIFAVASVIFLLMFFRESDKWWAAIPGFTLAGMSVSSLLLDRIGWGGFAFLGGLGLGFWAVYFSSRERWWAIILGGVLVTLGFVSALSENYPVLDSRGVLFAGLGLTFLLVALLAKMRWAYIPAALLLLLGFVLHTPFVGFMEYAWIGLLLLAGIIMVIAAARPQ